MTQQTTRIIRYSTKGFKQQYQSQSLKTQSAMLGS